MAADDHRWTQAGAALRARADDRSRTGPGVAGVTRLARRRRAVQGSLAAVVVVAVAGVGASLLSDGVASPSIAPVAPPSAAPSERDEGVDEGTSGDTPEVDAPRSCDVANTADALATPASLGAAAAPAPQAVAGAPLIAAGERLFALTAEDLPAFAAFTSDGEWVCLAAPDLEGRRVAVGGDHHVLAVSPSGAALYDLTSNRWDDVGLPDLDGAEPVAGTWTGDAFVVAVSATQRSDDSRILSYVPASDTWHELASPPFAVNRDYHTSLLWDGAWLLLFGNWLDGSNVAASDTALLAAYEPGSETWTRLPDSPLSPQAARAEVVGEQLVAVDYGQQFATFDLITGSWSAAAPTGLDASECPPNLAAGATHVLLTACSAGAILDVATGDWQVFTPDGSVARPTVLADGDAAMWRSSHEQPRAVELLNIGLDEAAGTLRAAASCPDITRFGEALQDTGMSVDDGRATGGPAELADDVDLVAIGHLTGEVETMNGPGPAGEAYVAYEIQPAKVLAGEVTSTDPILVSVAFDGSPQRAEALQSDVPVGAEVVAFAYEVTHAPGELVAAQSGGFTVACDGGPPLGAPDGQGWDDLDSIDDLVPAVTERAD